MRGGTLIYCRRLWASAVLSSRGGVAAPLIKFREATKTRADGVVARGTNFHAGPPRPLHQRRLRSIFLMSRPPLLSRRGLACMLP